MLDHFFPKISVFLLLMLFQSAQAEPYKIGVILPLSGKSASVGQPIRQAAALAEEKLPAGQRKKIKLIFEDDQMLPRRTVAAFQKLVSINQIKAAIVLGSAMGNALAPLAERKGIILFALVASDSKVWEGRKHVFSHWMPLELQAQAMAAEIRRRGYKRIAMVSQEQEGINAIDQAFLTELKEQGLEHLVVLQEKPLMDDFDFRMVIAKIRSLNVDGVYLVTLPGAAEFSKQAREQGVTAELFGVQTFENEAQLKASNGALVGSWYVQLDEPREFFQKAFREKYQQHTGLGTVNGYDAVQILAQAVSVVGADNNSVVQYIHGLKGYQGAAGTYSSAGHRFTLPVAVKVISKEGFQKLPN